MRCGAVRCGAVRCVLLLLLLLLLLHHMQARWRTGLMVGRDWHSMQAQHAGGAAARLCCPKAPTLLPPVPAALPTLADRSTVARLLSWSDIWFSRPMASRWSCFWLMFCRVVAAAWVGDMAGHEGASWQLGPGLAHLLNNLLPRLPHGGCRLEEAVLMCPYRTASDECCC